MTCIEKIETPNTAKLVLHQAARMIWLADRMGEFARGRPALQILFFMITAEAVAKLVFGYEGEGESKRHVDLFLKMFVTTAIGIVLIKPFRKVWILIMWVGKRRSNFFTRSDVMLSIEVIISTTHYRINLVG